MDSLTKEKVVKMVKDHGFYLDIADDNETLHIRHLACPNKWIGHIYSYNLTIAKGMRGASSEWIMFEDTLAEQKIHNALQNLLVKIRKDEEDKIQERIDNVQRYFGNKKKAKDRADHLQRILDRRHSRLEAAVDELRS